MSCEDIWVLCLKPVSDPLFVRANIPIKELSCSVMPHPVRFLGMVFCFNAHKHFSLNKVVICVMLRCNAIWFLAVRYDVFSIQRKIPMNNDYGVMFCYTLCRRFR